MTRHEARRAALQTLYFWEIGKTTPDDALAAVLAEQAPEASDDIREFIDGRVRGTVEDVAALDSLIAQHASNWRIERLAVIDRLILRLAVWELRHDPATPAAVVIDEAVELARAFGGDDSVKFVNGVLDGIKKGLRPD